MGRAEEALDVAAKMLLRSALRRFSPFSAAASFAQGHHGPAKAAGRTLVDRGLDQAAEVAARAPGARNFGIAQERYADAQTLYRKVLAADPKNVMAANNLAVLLALHQKAPEAVELSRQAIDHAGPLAPLLDTRGTAYLSAGQTEHAVGDLEEAVAQQPSAPRYYHLRGPIGRRRTAARPCWLIRKPRSWPQRGSLHPLERAENLRGGVEAFGDASARDR